MIVGGTSVPVGLCISVFGAAVVKLMFYPLTKYVQKGSWGIKAKLRRADADLPEEFQIRLHGLYTDTRQAYDQSDLGRIGYSWRRAWAPLVIEMMEKSADLGFVPSEATGNWKQADWLGHW